jgi:hypothetical protein
MLEFYIGDYCKVVNKGDSKDVLLVFSAIGVPKGKFNGTNALKHYNLNIIYLNCNRTWYLNGIPGLGDSLESTIAFLKGLIYSFTHGQGRLIAYGGSMGGYGAILYACLLNAEIAIATGAELKMLIKGGITRKVLKSSNINDINKLIDLHKIINESPTSIYIYYGENYYPDLMSGLEVIEQENVILNSLKNFNHALPPYIDKVYGLQNFIDFHIKERKSFKFLHNELGDLFQYRRLIRTLYQVLYKFESFNKDKKNEIVQYFKDFAIHQKFSDNSKSHALFGLSTAYQKLNHIDLSILACEQSTQLNPSNMLFWMKLAKLIFNKQQYLDVIVVADKIIELEKPEFNLDGFEAFSLKIESLIHLNRREEAIKICKSFRAHFPSNTKRSNRISILMRKI